MPAPRFRRGPVRNRRAVAGGGPPRPYPLILPVLIGNDDNSNVNTTFELQVLSRDGFGILPVNYMNLTGMASRMTLLVFGGAVIRQPNLSVDASNVLTAEFLGTHPPGAAVFAATGFDPSVRGRIGEWIGTGRFDLVLAE